MSHFKHPNKAFKGRYPPGQVFDQRNNYKGNINPFSNQNNIRNRRMTQDELLATKPFKNHQNYNPHKKFQGSRRKKSIHDRIGVMNCPKIVEEIDLEEEETLDEDSEPEIHMQIKALEAKRDEMVGHCNGLRETIEQYYREICKLEALILKWTQEIDIIKRRQNIN